MKRGFTLIELLVVIAIIGLLSSIVLASLNTAREKARDAKRQGDLHSLQTAIETYYTTYMVCTHHFARLVPVVDIVTIGLQADAPIQTGLARIQTFLLLFRTLRKIR